MSIDKTLWDMLDNTDAVSLLKQIEKKEKPAKPRALKRTPRGMEVGRASVFTIILSRRKGKSRSSSTPDSSQGLVGSSELPTRNRKAPETVRKTRVAKQPDLVTEFRGR